MEFIHQPYIKGETIAAIATPIGEGGVAIIRISGDKALDVAEKVTSKKIRNFPSHTAHFVSIKNNNGEKIDEGLLLPMLNGKSYTGEDTIEIHCHGGSLITRRVLDVILNAGARAARPGEFTFKAFMNGKIDLSQAEAVQDLIGAKNERALDAAEKQLDGSLSTKVQLFQEKLNLIAAILEAFVDFPDEGLEFASQEEIIDRLQTIIIEIQKLIDTFHDGKILHDGLTLCLIGAPNAGKSSLMNALLDKERAIVSATPGTTRDILEDEMRLFGLNFKILDTAGLRETTEEIEQEGIRRAKAALNSADLILVVLDLSHPMHFPIDLEKIPKDKSILVWNKVDLYPHFSLEAFPHQVVISALKKEGLDALKQEIEKVVFKKGVPSKEEVIVTNVRHMEALQEAKEHLITLKKGLENGVSPEFLSIDMKSALYALGRIIGRNVGEDVLSAIFSTFCIGK